MNTNIIICNDSATEPTLINYLITRKGDVIAKNKIAGNNIYVALQNKGPVVRSSDGWVAAHCINNAMKAIIPHQKIIVPYEFCSLRPWHGWTLYEYYPERQLRALEQLYNQIKETTPDVTIQPMYAIDPKRSDPQPQIELKNILNKLRHDCATEF